MPPEQKYRLGDVLVDQGLISLGQLSKALELQKTGNQRIGKTLVQMKAIAERDVISALSYQAVFNRRQAEKKQTRRSNNVSGNKSNTLKRTGIILLAVSVCTVALVLLNNKSNEQSLPANYQPSVVTVAPQTSISTESLNTSAFTNASASIKAIEIYESALQQQFIFHSSASLKHSVDRQYGAGNSVRYFFDNAALADNHAVINVDNGWIYNTNLSQTAEGLLWTFQLIDAGSAKYHEIGPTADNPNYQFVVVIRKTND